MAYSPITNPLPSTLKDAAGTTNVGVEPFGQLITNIGYQTLLYDTWPGVTLDTSDKWNVTGTTPSIVNGMMTMVATASTYNAIQGKDIVRANSGFALARNGIVLETATATGAGRFWGFGTVATTPGPAVLAQNAIGFEIDQATGNLLAVTYFNGVRTQIGAALTRPTDGLNHGYGVLVRATIAYWLIDNVVVATQAFPNTAVQELPPLIVRQNAATFTGTPSFQSSAHLTADTSRPGFVISDPIIGMRMARVKAGVAAVTSDNALVVTLHPSSAPTATQNVAIVSSPSSTYSAVAVSLTPAALATDIFTITGSATKTVKITKIVVNGVQTTAAQVNILLVRRSTANTLGTSTAPIRITNDSTNVAATATVLAYTANPTIGTTVGTVLAARLFVPGAATASDAQGLVIQSGDIGQQNWTLRGTSEVLAVNLNGVTVAGGSLNISIEWTES